MMFVNLIKNRWCFSLCLLFSILIIIIWYFYKTENNNFKFENENSANENLFSSIGSKSSTGKIHNTSTSLDISQRYKTIQNIISQSSSNLHTHVKIVKDSSLQSIRNKLNFYDLKKPSQKNFDCVKTRTTPSFTICIHPVEKDVYISGSLKNGGIWEGGSTYALIKLLQSIPSAIFVDIGANIGYYTLLAAKMGHFVIAVEPVIDQVERLHKSLQLEQLTDRVILLQNAVDNKRGFGKIFLSKTNQGDSIVKPSNFSDKSFLSNSHQEAPELTHYIILNDLNPLLSNLSKTIDGTFNCPTVLKIDVQASEPKVLSTAEEFFDNNNIILVIIEWEPMSGSPNSSSDADSFNDLPNDNEDDLLRKKLIRFFKKRNYKPFTAGTGFQNPVAPSQLYKSSSDIWWVREDYLKKMF